MVYAMLQNDCLAGKALKACGVDAEPYAEYFVKSLNKDFDFKGYTPVAKHALETAAELAEKYDGEDARVGTEHLLLAVAESGSGLTRHIFKAMKVDLEKLTGILGEILNIR